MTKRYKAPEEPIKLEYGDIAELPDRDGDICIMFYDYDRTFFYLSKNDLEKMLSMHHNTNQPQK